jgi:hypothetical protein
MRKGGGPAAGCRDEAPPSKWLASWCSEVSYSPGATVAEAILSRRYPRVIRGTGFGSPAWAECARGGIMSTTRARAAVLLSAPMLLAGVLATAALAKKRTARHAVATPR